MDTITSSQIVLPFDLLQLERELMEPLGEVTFQKYDALLYGAIERLKGTLSKGVTPMVYARFEGVEADLIVARKLLWLVRHHWKVSY